MLNLSFDPVKVWLERILEPLQASHRIDNSLELLKSKLITLEHLLYCIFVKLNLVFLEEIYKLIYIKAA